MQPYLAIAAVILACTASAQGEILTGKVSDAEGRPVPDAAISFSILQGRQPDAETLEARYGLAQTRHALSLEDPGTRSDAEGRWHRELSASETAILTSGSHVFLMAVRATGFLPWFRAIGGDLRDAAIGEAILIEGQPRPYLKMQLTGGQRPYRGFALVERAFRVPDGDSVWLPTILPLSDSGQFEFYEAPRIPGELAALAPTAREEAYRLSFFVAGLKNRSIMIPIGEWRLALAADAQTEIALLDPSGEPSPGPIQATYRIAGQEVRMRLPGPSLPKLGSVEPLRLSYPKGALQLSAWPQAGKLRLLPTAGMNSAPEQNDRRKLSNLRVSVVDRRGRPIHGAAVWLEDAGVELSAPDSSVFAVSDAQGVASLGGLPRGEFRFRVQHPEQGSREASLRIAAAREEAIIPIRPQNPTRPPPERFPGTLLLDMGRRSGESGQLPTELGIITRDRRLIREDFANRPRWIRVDGLPPGAANLYLQSKGEKAILIAGVLSGDFDNPALRVEEIESRRFEMFVRDVEGNPMRAVSLSFGEGEPGSTPYTSRLIDVEKGETLGTFWFETPIHGNPLLRVHDDDGNYLDLEVPIKSQERFVEVVLSGR
ncbi:MAG: carboxypeptidase-like regulatory domain-containing protein [Planctomycetota bacterium]|jgi:hypothetical protein